MGGLLRGPSRKRVSHLNIVQSVRERHQLGRIITAGHAAREEPPCEAQKPLAGRDGQCSFLHHHYKKEQSPDSTGY